MWSQEMGKKLRKGGGKTLKRKIKYTQKKSKVFLRKMRLKGSGCWLWFPPSLSNYLHVEEPSGQERRLGLLTSAYWGPRHLPRPTLPRAVIRHRGEILPTFLFVTPSTTRSWLLCDTDRGLRRLWGRHLGKQVWVKAFRSYTAPHDKVYRKICSHLTKNIPNCHFEGFPSFKSHLQKNSTKLKIPLRFYSKYKRWYLRLKDQH